MKLSKILFVGATIFSLTACGKSTYTDENGELICEKLVNHASEIGGEKSGASATYRSLDGDPGNGIQLKFETYYVNMKVRLYIFHVNCYDSKYVDDVKISLPTYSMGIKYVHYNEEGKKVLQDFDGQENPGTATTWTYNEEILNKWSYTAGAGTSNHFDVTYAEDGKPASVEPGNEIASELDRNKVIYTLGFMITTLTNFLSGHNLPIVYKK